MFRFALLPLFALLALVTLADGSPGSPALPAPRATGATPSVPDDAQIAAAYGKLPLSFEANRGQTDARVEFLARGSGYSLFLTPSEAVLVLRNAESVERPRPRGRMDREMARPGASVLRLQLAGASAGMRSRAEQELAGKVNYFIGNDPAAWRTDIPTYGWVRYENVYPGIDLVYHGAQGQLEYDFIVAAGADPGVIALGFAGVEGMAVDAGGALVLQVAGGEIRQPRPLIYQEVDGARREVSGGYKPLGFAEIGFALSSYDATRPVVIDPVLVYSTYLGGSRFDRGFGIAVDASGSAYVTGDTVSSNFPTMAAFQPTFGGVRDAFVTKLTPTGSLVYSTYLGGSGSDEGFGIAVDASGSAYVTGDTDSSNFPTMAAFQPTPGGSSDAFVTKLTPAGNLLVYSTYLGGSGFDRGLGIAVDALGSASVTGETASSTFPTMAAFQPTLGGSSDAFVTKLTPTGSLLVYSTYLGGSGFDEGLGIAVDASGAYVTGLTISSNFPTMAAFQPTLGGSGDAFVTKLTPTGGGLVYSTYLGGTGGDVGRGIAVDALGSAYVTGETASSNFPTMAAFQPTFGGAEDAFVTKLTPTGSGLVYSTYLGGSGFDEGSGIAVDASGGAYVTGQTISSNFPTMAAFQPTLGGSSDAFVTKLTPTGNLLVYSTYLGGNGDDRGLGIAVDALGSAYVTGHTASSNFPTTTGAFQPTLGGIFDAFVAKIGGVGPPATVMLSPKTATNTVGTTHCVTATVKDASGNAVANVIVRFSVPTAPATHASPASGSATTNSSGQATFCYSAALPGQDAIHAFTDSNSNGQQDPGEPFDDAAKTWTLPASTALCEVTITQGGWIIADNGDRANFGGNAKVSAGGTSVQGHEDYQDHGPAQPLNVHSIELTATTCSGDLKSATIFGRATINGSENFVFRIDVVDQGEPGTNDSYGIMLSNGYASGQHLLQGGNVQIHR